MPRSKKRRDDDRRRYSKLIRQGYVDLLADRRLILALQNLGATFAYVMKKGVGRRWYNTPMVRSTDLALARVLVGCWDSREGGEDHVWWAAQTRAEAAEANND